MFASVAEGIERESWAVVLADEGVIEQFAYLALVTSGSDKYRGTRYHLNRTPIGY